MDSASIRKAKVVSVSASERARIAILIVFSVVLVSVFLTPFTLASGSINNLSGKVGQEDSAKVIDKMNPFAAAVYTVGDYYCDQLSSHSYYLNGNQMAFSSRVVGIFAGLFMGILVAIIFRPKINGSVLVGLIPMLVDWGMQFISAYPSLNLLRTITGIIAGAAISLFISYCIRIHYSENEGRKTTGMA
jgi:uncharacterized membrane protein